MEPQLYHAVAKLADRLFQIAMVLQREIVIASAIHRCRSPGKNMFHQYLTLLVPSRIDGLAMQIQTITT
ncbi:hypothetical protein Cagg_3489 [Chloroflexus aggregans DSM 9485]|uniref:Uncharacterized protein n=1 Tax=Chloroflexus aggregans (strain MD-66 / DSM 9485) TaxID=326427 RepID=B8G9H5_CHLAD|nr:hypothetical protein Cagg_3489 [Chloroflexus aggregans DSM 9485]